jgi:eukaryotic translation initiation factor 2C
LQEINREDAVIEENPGMKRAPARNRVDDMLDQIKRRFPDHRPTFLLCVLPERKNCDIYGLLLYILGLQIPNGIVITAYPRVSGCLLLSFLLGPWKRVCLADFGIVTQCLGPPPSNINDQYLTNLLLKINAKVFHSAITDRDRVYGFL